ncbi:MAG: ATP-binding protein [Pseudomonadota bacterium]|nr:ATP-binding protein [Pseudomonadota bacterium]
MSPPETPPAPPPVAPPITPQITPQITPPITEGWFRALFEHSPTAMAVLGADGRTHLANDALGRLLGRTAAELIGVTLTEVTHPDDLAECLRRIQELHQIGTLDWEKRYVRGDGTIVWGHITGSLWTGLDGVRWALILIEDITAAREQQEELQLLNEHLRRSQRTEAVGRVAGGVVHDFNNMLAVILNVAELARMRAPDTRSREYAEQIHSAAMRAAALSKRLMSFGRRDSVAPELLDLNALIAENRNLLQRVATEDITCVTELTQPLHAVHIVRAQLEQVLLNLVVNARDAMPLGGRLTFRTAHRRLTTPELGLPAGDYVTLEVEDTGTGIAKELVSEVFVPFFTTKEDGRGTGLGLSIVKQVVTSGGGAVQVRTELGVGTTFLILLPAAKMALPREPSAPARQVTPGRGERVLVVEDELTLLDLTTQVLAENGYVPLAAPGAEPALELVRQMRNRVHLLLTDVVMPGMSGTDLAARVREIHPETRVLFMSGHPDDRLSKHASPGQTHQLLRKPFSSVELLAAIRFVLDQPPVVPRSADVVPRSADDVDRSEDP